jgi:hypothetical protein
MGFGGSNVGNIASAQAQAQSNLTNQSDQLITQAFSGFNPQYYQGIQNSYMNYALPQLQQQYQTANNQLGYKLAGQGITNGSAAQQAQNALGQSMNQNETQLGNQAVQAGQTQQQAVQGQENNLFSQAQTASDPGALAQQAIGEAGSISTPSVFAPLGQLFTTFGTDWLGNQLNSNYNTFANQYLNTISNPAIYGGGSNGATSYLGV